MSKDTIKPDEQLTLAQINRIRKQKQQAVRESKKAGNGGITKEGDVSQQDLSDDLQALTVDQLREQLTAKGAEIPAGAKKADLINLLKAE